MFCCPDAGTNTATACGLGNIGGNGQKGMFDCVMCSDDPKAAAQGLLSNISELLRPEGHYIVVSSAGPDERLNDLQPPGHCVWNSVEVTPDE